MHRSVCPLVERFNSLFLSDGPILMILCPLEERLDQLIFLRTPVRHSNHEDEDTCMSYEEEEDTCMSYEEEDTCAT
jgi:hypothetical protein